MVNETESRKVEVGAGILDPTRVNDRTYRIYEVTAPGEFVATRRKYTNPERIAEDAERGGDGTFEIVDFRLPVVQHWPERGKGESRELVIGVTKTQADAILEGNNPTLHIGTPLGRFTSQFGKVKAPAPNSDDVQGEVFLVAEYSTEWRERTERRYDIVSHLGDRLDFDLDAGIELAEEEAKGNRRRVS